MVWVKINYKQSLGVSKDKADDLFRQYHAKYHLLNSYGKVMSRAQDSGQIELY
jgi:hypothetical protein